MIIPKILKKSKFKKFNPYFAVIEIDMKSYNSVMKDKRLRLGWDNCFVNDGTYVKRCFKCLGYNHTSKECDSVETVCNKCAENHHADNCKSDIIKCVNCNKININFKLNLNTSHHAFDITCPVFQKKLNIEKQKVF